MKKWYALLVFIAPMLFSVAQPCTPNGTPSSTGFLPLPADFPCITQNQSFSQTVFFKNANFFNTFGGFQVDTLELLNVLNLPDSIHYGANKTPAKYLAAENGCLQIYGNTPDTIGQYKLRIYIKMTMHQSATPNNKFAVQGEADSLTAALGQGSIFRYYVRVIKNCGMACPDVQDTSTRLFIPYGPKTPEIALSGDTVFCSGKSVTLSVDSSIGSFRWSTGDTTSFITVSGTGNYSVTAYSNCDSSVSRSQHIQVNPGIVATDTIIRNVNEVMYVAQPAGAQYRWILRAGTDSILAGENSDTLHRNCTNIGYYGVIVSALGCSDTSEFKNYACIPENGIPNLLSIESVKLWPNPTSGKLNVLIEPESDLRHIKVVDVLGKEQLHIDRIPSTRTSLELDLNNCTPGIYMVTASGAKGTVSYKVVKQ
ncbi:MAG: T9SS type A sorting domain-containing protein [Chitinophagales bacterium]